MLVTKKTVMYECTKIATGKTGTISPQRLAKQIVKNPELLTLYSYKIVEDKRNMYSFECWIHPKSGGDDYMEGYEVSALDEKSARAYIEKTLKRKSAITNDYIITHVNGKQFNSGKKVKVKEVTIEEVKAASKK